MPKPFFLSSPFLVAGVLVTLVATGCRETKNEDDPAISTTTLAENGTDTNEIESHVSSLTAAVTLSSSNFETAERAASAASSTKSFFIPATCLTTTASGTTVTHVFDGCTGPWGLLRVFGKVIVRYATTTIDGRPALDLDITGEDLRIQRATVDFHAKATLGVPANGGDADRVMTYRAQVSGTTARGREVARNTDLTLGWRVGDTCLKIDGTAEGNVTGRNLKTTVESFRRCRGACPEAGGKITIEDTKSGAKLSIAYDGDATATVTRPDGATSEVKLLCGLLQ